MRKGTAPPPNLKIDGPAAVVVGEPTKFKALADDEPIAARWTLDPQDAGTLESTGKADGEVIGDSVSVLATKKSVFKLRAEAEGWSPGTVLLTAIAAPTETGTVAFVGRGYGTIMIAIVILTIAGVLGLVGALGSEAVATLFGAVAGYIFLKAQSGGDTSAASGDQTTTST
jgi:hypothetical protein